LEITSLQSNAEGRVCLQGALKLLKQKGIKNLMVEGGANVISAFLSAGFVDAVVITISPRFIGGYKAVNDAGKDSPGMPQIKPFFSAPLGDDLILWGKLNYADHAA
jgi:riboflavin biosynthesis pyrimidine reductase